MGNGACAVLSLSPCRPAARACVPVLFRSYCGGTADLGARRAARTSNDNSNTSFGNSAIFFIRVLCVCASRSALLGRSFLLDDPTALILGASRDARKNRIFVERFRVSETSPLRGPFSGNTSLNLVSRLRQHSPERRGWVRRVYGCPSRRSLLLVAPWRQFLTLVVILATHPFFEIVVAPRFQTVAFAFSHDHCREGLK